MSWAIRPCQIVYTCTCKVGLRRVGLPIVAERRDLRRLRHLANNQLVSTGRKSSRWTARRPRPGSNTASTERAVSRGTRADSALVHSLHLRPRDRLNGERDPSTLLPDGSYFLVHKITTASGSCMYMYTVHCGPQGASTRLLRPRAWRSCRTAEEGGGGEGATCTYIYMYMCRCFSRC